VVAILWWQLPVSSITLTQLGYGVYSAGSFHHKNDSVAMKRTKPPGSIEGQRFICGDRRCSRCAPTELNFPVKRQISVPNEIDLGTRVLTGCQRYSVGGTTGPRQNIEERG